MRLSAETERSVLESIRRNPDDHVVWRRDAYTRPDGALQVYRDGLSEFLHRRLFRLLVDEQLARQRLARTCPKFGCVNPHHWRITGEREVGARMACVNGHAYTPANTTPSGHCRICAERRAARRASHAGPDAAAINAAKPACPAGHPYDEANTYVYVTNRGVHRKCRRCNAERIRQRRAAAALAA